MTWRLFARSWKQHLVADGARAAICGFVGPHQPVPAASLLQKCPRCQRISNANTTTRSAA